MTTNQEAIEKHDGVAEGQTDALPPLRSVHTESFPQLLTELQASIALTTYQAGKLVFLRPQAGTLNTHFREFEAPMGLAANTQILSIAHHANPPRQPKSPNKKATQSGGFSLPADRYDQRG